MPPAGKYETKGKKAYINNELNTLDVKPIIVDNSTMILLRFVTESLEFKVDWDNDTGTVNITTRKNTPGHE